MAKISCSVLKLIAIIAFWCIGFTAVAQDAQQIELMHWSRKKGGLAHEVVGFVQDEKGFLWVATQKTLSRFDGESFLNIPLDFDGVNVTITKLAKSNGLLFLRTSKDTFFAIDPKTFSCSKISKTASPQNQLNEARALLTNTKLITYNKRQYKLANQNLTVNGKPVLTASPVSNIYKDSNNNLWISDNQGIGFWDDALNQVTYVIDTAALQSLYGVMPLSTSKVSLITEDGGKRVWFYRSNEAVGFWDYKTEQFYTIRNIREYPYFKDGYKLFLSLFDLEIKSLFTDQQGHLWIGTAFNGLLKVHLKQEPFLLYEFDFGKNSNITTSDVSCPYPLKNGDLWIGTFGGGIKILKKEDIKKAPNNFTVLKGQAGVAGKLGDNEIFPIFEDSKGNIWVGTNTGGLFIWPKANRNAKKPYFKNWHLKNPNPGSIRWIIEDHSGIIWIASTTGLTRYLPQKNTFERSFKELKNPNIFKDNYIQYVFEDAQQDLWIATDTSGVYKWNKKTHAIKHIKNFGASTADSVLTIVEQPQNTLWLSGLKGLFRYDILADTLVEKVPYDKLKTDHIESLIYDANNTLWLGTNGALRTYNIENGRTKSVDLSLGVRVNLFTRGAYKDEEGDLYFGTRNGFYQIHPNNFIGKSVKPIFTDVKIDGVSYRKQAENLINTDISVAQELKLSHKQNSFSIYYKALDYTNESEAVYETAMVKNKGQENWVTTTDTYRFWNDLAPGKYTFKVRSRDTLASTAITIVVLPPWWKTKWAFGLFVLAALLGLYGLLRAFVARALIAKQKEQKETFDKLRFKFFLNVAHEVRTPLTLIKGGLERINHSKAVYPSHVKELERVAKNTDRLYRLINEVLDLKRIERTHINVQDALINLKWFLENIVDIFRLRENDVRIVLNMPESPVWVRSDRQLLESVVYNLISNAIKFSDADAEILIELAVLLPDQIKLNFIDKGVGIRKEEQQLIFERLYQSEDNLRTGTGLGLAIVKQYVGLLKGTVSVSSTLNKGSTFTVILPYKEAWAFEGQGTAQLTSDIPVLETQKGQKPGLLVIDDQKELRTFIKEIFEDDFDVIESVNGQEGLQYMRKYNPVLVISDIMMPVMNGVEFCIKVRADIAISHIPIILLTAKTGESIELESIASGADAYLSKPFKQNLLKAKAKALIASRKKLIEKFNAQGEELSVLAVNNTDKVFLQQFEEVLKKRYMHSDLSVEELASEMAMSVSSFYVKIKSISGSAPVEFVRTYRLQKASRLLKETNMSVTEISESVGFGTRKYFSHSFKKHFNKTPLAYRKEGRG